MLVFFYQILILSYQKYFLWIHHKHVIFVSLNFFFFFYLIAMFPACYIDYQITFINANPVQSLYFDKGHAFLQ